ncbi:MAG: MFS transporter, partial [Lachnospiraceae bacterium]|nr:MFS transporter [Lachnospiraceae bacterium]
MENTQKMKWYHYLGFAFGEMGYTIQNTFVASYMLVYFTQIMRIDGLVFGTMTLVCRIVDAFTDLGFGVLADRTKKNKWGKFKPWYACSIIPT